MKDKLKEIYTKIRNVVDFKFKPVEDFDLWYRKHDKYLLIPNPSIETPEKAINSSSCPNLWINNNDGHIGVGIAYWCIQAVEERFVCLAKKENSRQLDAILDIWKGLSDDWSFSISKKKRFIKAESQDEYQCNKITLDVFQEIVDKVTLYRDDWHASDKGAVPAVSFMNRYLEESLEEDYLQAISECFAVFMKLESLVPTKNIVEVQNTATAPLLKLLKNLENTYTQMEEKHARLNKVWAFRNANLARQKKVKEEIQKIVKG
jgi:hypothetical protein